MLCLNVRKITALLIEIAVWLEVEDFSYWGVRLIKLAIRNTMSCCLSVVHFLCPILTACCFHFFLFFPFLFY